MIPTGADAFHRDTGDWDHLPSDPTPDEEARRKSRESNSRTYAA